MEHTYTMIKPHAVRDGHIGDIISEITDGGFGIVALKMVRFTHNMAAEFYSEHKEKPFFSELVDNITAGNVIAMVIEGENVIERFRSFIGSTNPKIADTSTIRYKYGVDISFNAIHASDSINSSNREISLIFEKNEIC